MAAVTKASQVFSGALKNAGKSDLPEFIQQINDDYQAQVSHTFIVHGNIYDFVDNTGSDLSIRRVLAASYDDNIQQDLSGKTSEELGAGVQENGTTSKKIRIMAFYNSSMGLEFPNPKSKEMWKDAFAKVFGKERVEALGEKYFSPGEPAQALALFNDWFYVSKELAKSNFKAKQQKQPMAPELVLTLVFSDADTLFPQGDVASLYADRLALVYLRNWAQDEFVGARNRLILMTRHLDDIHESIRGELAVSRAVRKPNLQDRSEWITNFNKNIGERVKAQGGPLTIGKNDKVNGVEFAEGFDLQQFAVQSAGMNRRQIKDVILASWRSATTIDFSLVQERKKRALEDEYQGMIDIKEPEFGFEQIGGHEHFKEYCRRKIILPLKKGNRRQCSRGAVMTGPPGTGKTMLAWALAKEAGVNFIIVDLGKVFSGLVGSTEKNMRKTIEAIEAAAPCVVFIDEIDSVLSSGRVSMGDGGTSARVFNNFMTWLSDPSRVGKVVVLAATNKPELLDAALIRAGRLDAKIPILPPQMGDAKGRWNVLAALTKKLKIVLHEDLVATSKSKDKGLGVFLYDDKRLWTGAETEQLLQAAWDEAVWAERKTEEGKSDIRVTVADWDAAMDDVIANTAEVEAQTQMALAFVDRMRFCPEDWKEQAREATKRKAELIAAARAGQQIPVAA